MINYRTLGRTGMQVSSLGLGTVELGRDYGIEAPGHFGRPPTADAISLVHAALDAGINYIDTARVYGESEKVLGEALEGLRDEVVLATKFFASGPDGEPLAGEALRAHMRAELETSLRLLRTDFVDLWQLHNLDAQALGQIDVVAEVFDEARQSGKLRWTGVSAYGTEYPRLGLETDVFDVLQVPYSVIDQRADESVMPTAKQRNVGIVARSILLKGALTPKADHLPDHLEVLKSHSRRFRDLVEASGLGLTPVQAAIAFGLAHAQIGTVLIGVRTVQELEENLKATEYTLPGDLLAALDELRLKDPDLLHPGTWGIP